MNHDELRVFCSLANTLHFGRTGRACHLSRSAVTRTIQRLEDSAGAPLVNRDPRNVELTSEGLRFLEYAEDTLARWQRYRQGNANIDELEGELRIFCSATAGHALLPDVLRPFLERYPRIRVQLETGSSTDALQMLDERNETGAPHLVVSALPRRAPRSLVHRLLVEEPIVFVQPSFSCAVTQAIERRPIRWNKVPLIAPRHGEVRERVERWRKTKRIPPEIGYEPVSHEAVCALVASGAGVGVTPLLTMHNSALSSRIRVVDARIEIAPLHVSICTLKRKLKDPVVQSFWDSVLPK